MLAPLLGADTGYQGPARPSFPVDLRKRDFDHLAFRWAGTGTHSGADVGPLASQDLTIHHAISLSLSTFPLLTRTLERYRVSVGLGLGGARAWARGAAAGTATPQGARFLLNVEQGSRGRGNVCDATDIEGR